MSPSSFQDTGGSSTSDPRRAAEDLGSKAIRLIAGNSPLGFLVGLSSRIWPALELEGEIVVGDDWELVWGVRLKRGKRFFHAWQVEVSEDQAAIAAAADELAHRIAMDTARLGVLSQEAASRGRKGALGTVADPHRSADTRNWRAFRALTEAMTLWNAPDFSPNDKASVAAVDAKLEEAVTRDPGYSLAHCNRGALLLTTFSDAATNDQARHRFGRLDPAIVERAREAAQEATNFLKESPESLYALAFAWHCTETLEDIMRGREVYEKIIDREPTEYVAVHNNLGFILLKGGEHLHEQGRESEAREWWREAEKQLRTTVEIEGRGRTRWEFAHANLGGLYRLQQRFVEGEKEYMIALGPEPEASTYTSGLNELARLYQDWAEALEDGTGTPPTEPDHDGASLNQHRQGIGGGSVDPYPAGVEGLRTRAQRFHELALATIDDEDHRRKLVADFSG